VLCQFDHGSGLCSQVWRFDSDGAIKLVAAILTFLPILSFQLRPVQRTMRKFLLAALSIIAGMIIAAETAELALDANGNTAKILIPKDAFTIEE
jgi:tryptophan-rich sensory protein